MSYSSITHPPVSPFATDPLPGIPNADYSLKWIAYYLQSLSLGGESGGPGFGIIWPGGVGSSQTFTYYGSTNNVKTINYLQNGALVGMITLTYVNGGVANSDNVATIERTA